MRLFTLSRPSFLAVSSASWSTEAAGPHSTTDQGDYPLLGGLSGHCSASGKVRFSVPVVFRHTSHAIFIESQSACKEPAAGFEEASCMDINYTEASYTGPGKMALLHPPAPKRSVIHPTDAVERLLLAKLSRDAPEIDAIAFVVFNAHGVTESSSKSAVRKIWIGTAAGYESLVCFSYVRVEHLGRRVQHTIDDMNNPLHLLLANMALHDFAGKRSPR